MDTNNFYRKSLQTCVRRNLHAQNHCEYEPDARSTSWRIPQNITNPEDALLTDDSQPISSAELALQYENLDEAGRQRVSRLLEELRANRPPKNRSHRVHGRLVFETPLRDGSDKPLHAMLIELWDRDPGNPDDFLARGETDAEGYFELGYDPADAGAGDLPELELRIFETQHTYHVDARLELTPRLIHIINSPDDVSTQDYDFGTQRIPYWEYDPNTPLPRAFIPEQGNPPQGYAPGRTMTMIKEIAPLELVKRKHLLLNKLDPHKPTLAEIHADYPENLTRRLERENPGSTRSDEFFGERILNGMTASLLNKDPHVPGRYWLYHHWNSYEHDGLHALPNVDMRFVIRDGKLYPVQITLFLREPGASAPNSPLTVHTFTPESGPGWLQAKRIARVSAALSAELDAHLTTTHLNTEQYAVAAYRNLRKNPVRFLLFPHLKEVVLINHSANTFLLGENGHITRACALTADALEQRIRETMGTLDWKNWHPRQPLTPGHHYAQAANLFWQVIGEYVEAFFEQNRAEIERHWHEIHRFSDELVAHSVPLFLCDYLQGQVIPPRVSDWFLPEERMDLSAQRTPIEDTDGQSHALSPITQADVPAAGDFDNLKQVCRYVIMHATFMHTWPNARQYDDGGDVFYNGLGLRFGEHGIFSPENDESIAPDPVIATEQLWISYMLSKSGYGFILKNEERDIHPDLPKRLRQQRQAFADWGLDIKELQSRTNI